MFLVSFVSYTSFKMLSTFTTYIYFDFCFFWVVSAGNTVINKSCCNLWSFTFSYCDRPILDLKLLHIRSVFLDLQVNSSWPTLEPLGLWKAVWNRIEDLCPESKPDQRNTWAWAVTIFLFSLFLKRVQWSSLFLFILSIVATVWIEQLFGAELCQVYSL